MQNSLSSGKAQASVSLCWVSWVSPRGSRRTHPLPWEVGAGRWEPGDGLGKLLFLKRKPLGPGHLFKMDHGWKFELLGWVGRHLRLGSEWGSIVMGVGHISTVTTSCERDKMDYPRTTMRVRQDHRPVVRICFTGLSSHRTEKRTLCSRDLRVFPGRMSCRRENGGGRFIQDRDCRNYLDSRGALRA